MIEALDGCGIPYALIAPGLEIAHARSVATDEYGGAAAMTRHLVDFGHRRMGFIKGPEGHRAAADRLKACCDVLAELGDEIELLVEDGRFDFTSGHRAAESLLANVSPPTAIFCANDDMAAGAIAAAARRGIRVPNQLSIAGFDDSAVARITSPALTTVRQPLGAMATAAVELLAAAGGKSSAESLHVTLPFKIIERAST